MYLALLKEEEKELFFSIAHALAIADGVFAENEKAIIDSYCQEMEFSRCEQIWPFEKAITRISEISDEKTKKIILFESIGLAMVDKNYDENERILIKRMQEALNLEKEFAIQSEKVLIEYISFQDRINRLIFG